MPASQSDSISDVNPAPSTGFAGPPPPQAGEDYGEIAPRQILPRATGEGDQRSWWRGQPKTSSTDTAPLGLALILGIVAFLVIRGPATLDPTNILWLDQNDRAMHTLGWWYFMHAPWGWPPGASPLNGLEYANGIGLADGLPLFAFPFKLLAQWLPRHFQYWGWWHLLSFALQAMFGALVAHRLGLSRVLSLIAALFCLFQPAFLARLDVHMALSGHWTILAAIALYLSPNPRRWSWPLLLVVVAAIHGYLLAMVAAIWIASIWQRLWAVRQGEPSGQRNSTPSHPRESGDLRPQVMTPNRDPRFRGDDPVENQSTVKERRRLSALDAVLELVLGLGGTVVVLWAAGILMVGSTASFGFGAFRMNLLGPVNPDGWSLLVPGVATSFEEWEGFNYLGLGVAGLLATGLALGWRGIAGAVSMRFLPLLLVVLGMAVFAPSNRIALGSIELITVPLPDLIERFAATFRSSGRMFWPAGYLLVFVPLVLLARRLPERTVLLLGLLALLVQVVDTQRGWRGLMVGPDRSGPVWSTVLTSPVWDELASRYQRLRALPVENGGEHWRDLAALAERHGIGTDAANLGRVDPTELAAAQQAGQRAVADGQFDADAFYVVAPDLVAAVSAKLKPGDLFGAVDGLMVLAPGGAARGIQLDR